MPNRTHKMIRRALYGVVAAGGIAAGVLWTSCGCVAPVEIPVEIPVDITGVDTSKTDTTSVGTGDFSPVVVFSGGYAAVSLAVMLIGYQRWKGQHGGLERVVKALEFAESSPHADAKHSTAKHVKEIVHLMGDPHEEGLVDAAELAIRGHLRKL